MIFRNFTTQLGIITIFGGLVTIFILISQPRDNSLPRRITTVSHNQHTYEYQSETHVNVLTELNKRPNRDIPEVEDIQTRIITCKDSALKSYYEQRGNYWVLANYFPAAKSFRCDESITYTTHAEYSYLDNLLPLVKRWQGPVSISIYSPGWDFKRAIKVITYLRECSDSSLIKDYVTFHIYFESNRMPKQKLLLNSTKIKTNCKENPLHHPLKATYRQLANLTYPVNMGRMIARDLSTTEYVLASDIELYPNPGLSLDFLDMIQRNDTVLQSPNPKVFVLPIFEADSSVKILPKNKHELVKLLKNELVIPFHKNVCPRCHSIPTDGNTNWTDAPFHDGYMNIYHVAKRQGAHKFWEPIYIGTKQDPGYDVRLSWEGQRDKMTQGYVLCLLDYEFHILDNAFLIHKPGIKHLSSRSDKEMIYWNKQQELIRGTITRELTSLYGKRKGCVLP